jgi:hypothetical protein
MNPAFFLFALAIAFWGVVLGGGAYAVRRFLRAYERRAGSNTELTALQERVAALEESLDTVQGTLERVSAGQEFTTKLLSERASLGERTT